MGSAFRFAGSPGPYAVGFKVIEQCDYSRVYGGTVDPVSHLYCQQRPRPLQTLIWYPARESAGRTMTVRDYVGLSAHETDFRRPNTSMRVQEWAQGMQDQLDAILWAVRDAPEASGRYPVVIYAPGLGNPAWDNADLCEYLASYGYLVLALPSLGSHTRAPSHDLAGAEPQVRDILFLVGFAHSIAQADVSQMAVVGFSWGGLTNIIAAARDSRIKALVCLDGSVRFSPGLLWKAGVVPQQMRIPLLSICQGQWSPEERAALVESLDGHEGRDVLNAWTAADLVMLYLLGFGHADHSSMAQRDESQSSAASSFYGFRKVDYGPAESIEGYAWLARYTLEFLNAYLKRDGSAHTFLRRAPNENGMPPRLATVRYRLAVPGASFAELQQVIVKGGFEHAAETYRSYRAAWPDFALNDNELADWADALLQQGHAYEAAWLLTVNAELMPHSATAWLSLGHAWRRAGHIGRASAAYQRVCGLEPWWLSVAAAEWLRSLGAESNSIE